MDAIKSTYKVTYNSTNITEDISIYLTELTYTDNVSGASDEFEIKLEDKEGRWANAWYPKKGAILKLELGYENGTALKPNDFELDEITLDGDKSTGDVVTIKAISGGVVKQLHSKKSHAHENKTLSEIVYSTAAKYGLTVVGSIEGITIGRVTQHRESDLSFLNRLADEYGYAFSVKGSKLSFVKLKTLEGLPKVGSIDKTDCINWSFRDKSTHVYNIANVVSHNPNKNKVVKSSYSVVQQTNNDGVQFDYLKEANNSLEIRTKTENEQQANAKSEAALHKVNSLQQTGYITLIGNTLLLAGCNVEITGFGVLSGIWNILKSKHKRDRANNYVTDIEIKRIVPASLSGSSKKPKTITTKASNYSVVTKNNADGIPFNYLQQ